MNDGACELWVEQHTQVLPSRSVFAESSVVWPLDCVRPM